MRTTNKYLVINKILYLYVLVYRLSFIAVVINNYNGVILSKV